MEQPMAEIQHQHAMNTAHWVKQFSEQFNVNVVLSPVALSPDVAEFCREAFLGLATRCQEIIDRKG